MSDEFALRSLSEVALMREAGRIVCEILDALEAAVAPGVSTLDLDRLAAKLIQQNGAKAAFKGYGPKEHPFPAVLCASVNHEVVHGIPSAKRVLTEGDLIKLDFGVSLKGWFADSARTVAVGQVSADAMHLIEVTRESLAKGIEMARAGNRIGDIGDAVQRHAEAKGCSVVRDFTGHGVGRSLHERPQVPNYGSAGSGLPLKAGMTLALEPMVNLGTAKVEVLDDEWTAVTLDRKLSAHFEHTILVTEGAAEILTRRA